MRMRMRMSTLRSLMVITILAFAIRIMIPNDEDEYILLVPSIMIRIIRFLPVKTVGLLGLLTLPHPPSSLCSTLHPLAGASLGRRVGGGGRLAG